MVPRDPLLTRPRLRGLAADFAARGFRPCEKHTLAFKSWRGIEAASTKPDAGETSGHAVYLARMAAKKIGIVAGASGALCLVLADARAARGLIGHGGTDESEMAAHEVIGRLSDAGQAVWVDAGGSHVADVWSVEAGLAVTSFYPEEEDDDEVERAVGELVDSLAAEDAEEQGSVEVSSGALAILLEYQDGAPITDAAIEQAARGAAYALPNGLIVPCRDGAYQVFRDELEHESDAGELEVRVRIIPAD